MTAAVNPGVVLVGAGFAGLQAAKVLKNSNADVTIIDRRNFHLFQPLLYQVATAALSPGDIAWPARSIFASQRNTKVLMMDVCAVDPIKREVGDGYVVRYDYLVLATGAMRTYFGNDAWAPQLHPMAAVECTRSRTTRGALTNKTGYIAIAGLAVLVWSTTNEPEPRHLASQNKPASSSSLK
jgi:NADH dehydrogenase